MSPSHSCIRRKAAAAALLALCAGTSSAFAQSLWSSATGTWSTGANWSPAGAPVSGATTILEFPQAAVAYSATNDIDGDFTLNRLIFSGNNTGGASLLRSGTQSLRFAANGGVGPEIQFSAIGGSRVISIPLVLEADTSVTSSITNGTNNLTINGGVSGAGKLVINYTTTGAAVILGGTNTHAGTQVIDGILALGSSATPSLGAGALTLSGGRVIATASGANYANTLNIAGNATVFRSTTNQPLGFTNGGRRQRAHAGGHWHAHAGLRGERCRGQHL
ncbi:MAG: hypothetical protein MUE42_10725 [Opitutaceae bacterium]|nr:hypothetical protein [Opitutaceae bacterium]